MRQGGVSHTCNAARQFRSRGGHVNDDGSRCKVAQQTGAAQDYIVNFRRQTKHRKDNVAVARNLLIVRNVTEILNVDARKPRPPTLPELPQEVAGVPP